MNRRRRPKPLPASSDLTRRRFIQASTVALAGATMFPPLALADSQSADAVLPTGMSLNWDATRVIAVNTKRSRASLDGIWRFIPAQVGEVEPPKLGWGFINVPGSWANWQEEDRSASLVASTRLRSPLLVLGSGPQWDNYDGAKVGSAWYERKVTIPAEWRGRVISLRFDRVCTDGIVYVKRVWTSTLAVGLGGYHACGNARQNGGYPGANGSHRRLSNGRAFLAERLYGRHLQRGQIEDARFDRQRLFGKSGAMALAPTSPASLC